MCVDMNFRTCRVCNAARTHSGPTRCEKLKNQLVVESFSYARSYSALLGWEHVRVSLWMCWQREQQRGVVGDKMKSLRISRVRKVRRENFSAHSAAEPHDNTNWVGWVEKNHQHSSVTRHQVATWPFHPHTARHKTFFTPSELSCTRASNRKNKAKCCKTNERWRKVKFPALTLKIAACTSREE